MNTLHQLHLKGSCQLATPAVACPQQPKAASDGENIKNSSGVSTEQARYFNLCLSYISRAQEQALARTSIESTHLLSRMNLTRMAQQM